ncbi:serine/threonine-protein kinase [Actinomadura alba]|uniref:serine/threonine-protein kinase n=1 Tax=Actinomadura alba TaxID=406431 RepID=UPI0031E3736C
MRTLGLYRLTGRLGEGGQGVVYLGVAPDGSAVAVKVLHERWAANPRVRERFAKEVAAARRVAPFCVAQVLDANLSGAPPYIVTEYVDGLTLQQSVRAGGPRSGPALHRLAVATATALAAIHEAGVVHRDFKPANVLLGSDGPRVIDFGIARTLDAADTLTGGIVGTPAYMAPEQFANAPIGPAADVFAWGCVIAFAATGSAPFGSDSVAAVTQRILYSEPHLGDLADPLRDIVAACLVKDPSRRPPMGNILMALLGRPATARTPIGEALAAGRRTAGSHGNGTGAAADTAPPQATSIDTAPTRSPGTLRTLAIGLGALATVAVLAVAALTWNAMRGDRSPGPSTPGGDATTPTTAANTGQMARSPRLGLEFWQSGVLAPMSFAKTGEDAGGKDVVRVAMRPGPFEFRFPKQPKGLPVQVSAWIDDSIFTIGDGGAVSDNPHFRPGTGIADFEFGSGTLYLNDQGHNYLINERIASHSAALDKVYFGQTWRDRQAAPLQQRKDDIFLTVFIDKDKDRRFSLTRPSEYEYVVLDF